MPQKPQERVSIFTWLIIGIVFVPCDLAKLPLLLVDFIPIVGLPISGIVGFLISVIENLIGFPALWLSGFYRKSSTSSVIITFSTFLLNFVPDVDDIPFTTPAILITAVKAHASDKAEQKDYKQKLANFQRQQAADQEEAIQQYRWQQEYDEEAAAATMAQTANDGEESYARAA